MSNYPYYFCEPHPYIRKGIIESHLELSKLNKTIYSEHPTRISFIQSFSNRSAIKSFFEKTLPSIETFTEIERFKKKELLYHKLNIEQVLQYYANFLTVVFGCTKVLRPEAEWKYKHSVIFLPEIPYNQIKARSAWLVCTFIVFHYNYLFKDIIMGFFYPDLLCDLQIGKEFELGYWASKLVEKIQNKT